MILEIEDQPLHIALAFVEDPQLMVGRSNVVKYTDNQVSFNRFSAASRI